MELDLTRWVIVTSNHGEKYVGQFPVDEDNGAEYLKNAVKNSLPIVLTEARLMLVQYGMGGEGGVQTMAAFVPIDLSDGPMEEIHVMPSSWYFPPTAPSVINKFKRLLKASEDAETANRMRESGLHLPGVRR
jgi:hypothetical protein